MAEQASALHPHRPKMDGSSDSICLNCLATVAVQHDAEQLDISLHHVCLPAFSPRRNAPLQQTA